LPRRTASPVTEPRNGSGSGMASVSACRCTRMRALGTLVGYACARPTASSCSAATLPLGLGSARSTQTLVHALHEFHRVGVDVISSQEHIDTTASPGEMLCTVMASLAQFERALISERVKAGMARARAQDQRISRTPDAPRGPRAYCGPLSAGGLDPSDKPAAEHCVEHSVE
jgi:hypothetical protein